MTRIRTTRKPEIVWQTRPAWQHPGRRRFVHGPLVPMETPRRDPTARIFIALAVLIASYFAGQEIFHQGSAVSVQQTTATNHGD